MLNITGVIEYKEIGAGAWALVTDSGTTYELKDPPNELQKPQLKVKTAGQIRDDVMTLAMIGPVLEVHDFEILN